MHCERRQFPKFRYAPPLGRMSNRRFFLTLSLSRRTYKLITIEGDFAMAAVSGKLGLRPSSGHAWKQDFEQLR